MKEFVMSFLLAGLGASPLFSAKWEALTSFPNVAWIGPPVSIFSDSVVQDFAGAGLNVNIGSGTRAENLAALDIAARHGVNLIISDTRFGFYGYGTASLPTDSATLWTIDSIIDDYKDHPAYFGFFLVDEPVTAAYPSMRIIRDRILQRDPDHLVYVNLAQPSEQGIIEYMDTIKPQMLSFDVYPCERGGARGDFFEILDRFRRVSMSYNVPLWAFAMSTNLERWSTPTEGTIGFQQYCNLAYGVKGLQYFTYGPVGIESPVLGNGAKTATYYVLKKVNNEIMAIAPLMAKLTSIGVCHSTPLPSSTQGFSPDSCIQYTTGDPVVAGFFRDSLDREYVIVVNRDHLHAGRTRLFTKSVTGFVEISKQTGAEMALVVPKGNSLALDFRPGEGRLFRIEKGVFSDTDKPGLDTLFIVHPDSVVILFDERVEKASAENTSNYSIPDIQVNGAVLRNDSATVVLYTAPVHVRGAYSVRVAGIKDLAGNAMDPDTIVFQIHPCLIDWSFDEGQGDTVHDASGRGNHGTRLWEASWIDGKYGKALSFAGGNVSFKPGYFTRAANSFTIMLWAKPSRQRDSTQERTSGYYWNTQQNYAVKMTNGDIYGPNHASVGLSIGTNGVSAFEYDGDIDYPYHIPALLVHQQAIADWIHVTLVYDNKTPKLYLDGVLVKTGLTSIKTTHPGAQLSMGTYEGGIDEYKVFSYALSQAEIDSVLDGQSTISGALSPTNQAFCMETSPSPFTSSVRITMNQAVAPGGKLIVVTMDGRVVADLSGKLPSREILWNPSRCGSGVYLLKLTQGKKVYTEKLIAIQ